MSLRQIVCVVEGQGEQRAVPILVERILQRLRREKRVSVDRANTLCAKCGDRITQPYDEARQIGVEYFVKQAARQKPTGILVVVDAEERCMKREPNDEKLGPHLLARAKHAADGIPVAVVVANRMFEAWILADFHSLRARGHLVPMAHLPRWKEPEEFGGCKGWMPQLLGQPYRESVDQARLSEHVSLPLRKHIRARSKSFWKLFREVDKLTR
jgi:hypothetical protein